MRRARPLPALVMPPRLTVSPVDRSEGTIPRLRNCDRSPVSASSVTAAIKSIPRAACKAVSTSASDHSGTASRIACSRRATRSLSCLTASISSSNAIRCSRYSSFCRINQSMWAGPHVFLPGVDPPETEHHRDDLLALAPEILMRSQAGAREIAHRLVPIVGNPNGGEFTGPQEFGQVQPVASICLYPLAGLLRD